MMLVRTELRPSPIDGLGLFALDFIPRGAPVWRFTPCFDILLPASLVAALPNWEFLYRYAEQCPVTGYFVLAGDDGRFMNHADDPNVGSHLPLADAARSDDALRDICPGEELTCDYRNSGMAPEGSRPGFPGRPPVTDAG